MEFKQAVITKQGRSLMAKLLTGTTTARFTKIVTSSKIYDESQLENLASIAEVKQSAAIQGRSNNAATVVVEGALNNNGLAIGYYIQTIGLYATDPSAGEILYSVAIAASPGYMPADTGVSQTGIVLKIITEVGNASKVDLKVDLAAVATYGDVERLRSEAERNFTLSTIHTTQVDQRLLQAERLLSDLNGVSGELTLNNARSYPFNNSTATVPIAPKRNNLDYNVSVDVLSETGGFAEDIVIFDKQLNGFKIRFTGSAKKVSLRYKLTGGLYK